MSIQRFETGPRMSQVVVHGNTVYLAGVVANKTAGESVTKQTEEILSIFDGHLASAGSDKSKLLTATIYISQPRPASEGNPRLRRGRPAAQGETCGYRVLHPGTMGPARRFRA